MDENSLSSRRQGRPPQWPQPAAVLSTGRQMWQRWPQPSDVLSTRVSGHSTRPPGVDQCLQVQSDQTGAEGRDLERNSPQQPQPTASDLARLLSRIAPARQIERIPQLIRAIFNGAPQDDEHNELQKRCSKYSQKALLFGITTFVAYLGSSSASSSTGNTVFKVAMAAFFIAIPIDLISATRAPKWGGTLVYLSWLLLMLQSYLLLISFHKDYICAIVPVLVCAVLLPCKQPSVKQDSTEGEPAQRLDSNEVVDQDTADQDLENIFDWSAGIVNCGGLINMIMGHYMYMVGPNRLTSASVIGFLFFFTIMMGLYLMMVTTVRTTVLTRYVSYLAYLLNALLVCTLLAILIHGVGLSLNYSHV